MTVKRAQELIRSYESNSWLIHRLMDDVTNAESLMRPPFPANNANWVLGHMLSSRHVALLTLGEPPFMPDEVKVVYESGSPMLNDPARARDFRLLLDDVNDSNDLLADALQRTSAAQLNSVVDTPFGRQAVWERIAGLQWHETFHLGQLDSLKTLIVDKR